MDYKKYLPTRDQLREIKSLSFLAHLIFQPNLWHFNRHSVSFAAFIGIFCCFLPMPFQMIPCTLMCIWLRCNIPLAIALVWISNPFTMPPMMYFCYRLGAMILGEASQEIEISLTLEWLSAQFSAIWKPLLLGCLGTGVSLGATAFVAIRIYWRWKIVRSIKRRKKRHEKSLAKLDQA